MIVSFKDGKSPENDLCRHKNNNRLKSKKVSFTGTLGNFKYILGAI